MASKTANEIKAKWEAAAGRIQRQIAGMDAYMERSDAPGEWTTREVLCHLLGEPSSDPVKGLQMFAERDLQKIDLSPGKTVVTEDRRKMTLKQFGEALEQRSRRVFDYLDTLSDADLAQRKARIPLLKAFAGTEEIPMQMFLVALIDGHLNDHAGQLAKIRKAVGLPEAH
jgi:hypothetical protein